MHKDVSRSPPLLDHEQAELTHRIAIVEKHVRFAFYHASAEAFASMLTDMPYKVSFFLCSARR